MAGFFRVYLNQRPRLLGPLRQQQEASRSSALILSWKWSRSGKVLLCVGHTLLHDAACGEVVKYCPTVSLNISDATYIAWSVRKAALGNIARVVSK
jgi:hypothetical protein